MCLINPFPAKEFILQVVVLSENSLEGKFREPEIFIQRPLLHGKMHKKSNSDLVFNALSSMMVVSG